MSDETKPVSDANADHREAAMLRVSERLRQRLWDLVRQQRMELHAAGLITNEEYAELAKDHAAVGRLETYDSLRAELASSQERERVLREEFANLMRVIEMMDPPDAGYIYDAEQSECVGCGHKAPTRAEIAHEEDCFQWACQRADSALATPETKEKP